MTLPPPPLEGYWFDYPDQSPALKRTGMQVTLANAAPPWMVVEQALSTITIGSHWPGKLWRVQVTTLGDMSGLVAKPGYWRAAAVELLEELPLSVLFGPHGAAVLDVFSAISNLSRAQAEALASNVNEAAASAYGRAWMQWAQSHGDTRSTQADEWCGTLAAPGGPGKQQSPIHSGFLLIHTLVWKRAKEVDGDDAFSQYEEDGETEVVLKPLWRDACNAMLYAAMAQGAPQCVSEADAAELKRAWSRVFPA